MVVELVTAFKSILDPAQIAEGAGVDVTVGVPNGILTKIVTKVRGEVQIPFVVSTQ